MVNFEKELRDKGKEKWWSAVKHANEDRPQQNFSHLKNKWNFYIIILSYNVRNKYQILKRFYENFFFI